MRKLRPPVKIFGGKFYLCDWIINQFPPNYESMTYLELFGGAASVLLNKKPSIEEMYNELYGPLANIFYCLRYYPISMIKVLEDIKYTGHNFIEAQQVPFEYGYTGSAVAELVLRRMSRGGMKKHFSWSNRLRGDQPGDVNAWQTFKKQLPLICDRLRRVEIQSRNALEIIDEHKEYSNTLFFIDPPYLHETRTAKSVYDCEMTTAEHEQLAVLLNKVKGKVLVSGYDHSLYRQWYKNWNWASKEMPNHSGQSKTKQRRVEYLIKNY